MAVIKAAILALFSVQMQKAQTLSVQHSPSRVPILAHKVQVSVERAAAAIMERSTLQMSAMMAMERMEMDAPVVVKRKNVAMVL